MPHACLLRQVAEIVFLRVARWTLDQRSLPAKLHELADSAQQSVGIGHQILVTHGRDRKRHAVARGTHDFSDIVEKLRDRWKVASLGKGICDSWKLREAARNDVAWVALHEDHARAREEFSDQGQVDRTCG